MIDQEAHDDVLGLVAESLDGVRLDRDVKEVVARGQMLRRRRHAAPFALVAGLAAASFGIATALGGGPAHDDSASFSVSTDPQTGTVAVRIYQFGDATGLQQALAAAGVHTIIHFDPAPTPIGPCTWVGVKTQDLRMVNQLRGTDDSEELFVYPAEDPSGSVYGISYYTLAVPGTRTLHMVSFTLLSGEPTGCVYEPN